MLYTQKNRITRINSADYTEKNIEDLIILCESLHSDCITQFRSDLANGLWSVKDLDGKDPQKVNDFLKRYFNLMIEVHGVNGEYHSVENLVDLKLIILPSKITRITMSNFSAYEYALKVSPSCHFTITIDFNSSEIFDLSSSPSQATRNESTISTMAKNHIFADGLRASFEDYFNQRKNFNFLIHYRNMYDLLLWLIYFPIVIRLVLKHQLQFPDIVTSSPITIQIVIGIFLFILLSLCFRITFNIGRWLFPYQQIISQAGLLLKAAKIIYSTIVIAIIGTLGVHVVSIFWDGLIK